MWVVNGAVGLPVRLIPKLEVKGPNLIKGIHLEGLRVVGRPEEAALAYYQQGADELIYMDVVASLYQRDNLLEIVRRAAEQIFIPLTVGGGVRSLEDVRALLRAGADKVAINTAAIARPGILTEAARAFGAQCITVSIEAKRRGPGRWEAYTDCGRQATGVDAVEWARRAAELGAGEVLLTSIDQDGTRRGFDVELVRQVATSVPVPVIASGGAGSPEDVRRVVVEGRADAVAVAHLLHFRRSSLAEIKQHLHAHGVPVRVPLAEPLGAER